MNCIFCCQSSLEAICDSCFSKKLDEAEHLRAEYQIGKPYPHIVLDGYFNDQRLNDMVSLFPAPSRKSDLLDYDFQPGKHSWDMNRGSTGASLRNEVLLD